MLLRHIYDLPVVPDFTSGVQWRTWLNIRVAADKYLVPRLEKMADEKYRDAALACTDADEIFDVLDTIWTEMSHDRSLVAFAGAIRRNNLGKLLKNARFREHLDRGGKEALWEQLDELAFAADLGENRIALCGDHKRVVFKSTNELRSGYKHTCTLCNRNAYNTSRHVELEVAWIPKHVVKDQKA